MNFSIKFSGLIGILALHSTVSLGGTLTLRQDSFEVDGSVIDSEYSAPAVAIRASLPDQFSDSSSLYVGTHEAGGVLQINRALFAFDLEPVRALLRENNGLIGEVSLVITTATANATFPSEGQSGFDLVRTLAFDAEDATWNSPGPDHPVGGLVGDVLGNAKLTAPIASGPGKPLMFSDPKLTAAFQDAIVGDDAVFCVMVKRTAEDDSRVAGYFFRPADDSFQHSSGSIEWRPTLIVELE